METLTFLGSNNVGVVFIDCLSTVCNAVGTLATSWDTSFGLLLHILLEVLLVQAE